MTTKVGDIAYRLDISRPRAKPRVVITDNWLGLLVQYGVKWSINAITGIRLTSSHSYKQWCVQPR